jgi:hypothetical protein
VLDENLLIAALRTTERNPVWPGIVGDAWESPRSGAAYHADKANQDRLVTSDNLLREPIGDWKPYLRDDNQEGF